MRYWLPPGVAVIVQANSVTLHFHNEEQANKFCDWLQWLDSVADGTEMKLMRPEEHTKQ